MKTISMPHGHTVKVDDEDFDRLSKFNWYLNDSGHAQHVECRSNQTFHLSHEVIGKPPKGYAVHHIDFDKSNYQSANLRFVPKAINSHYFNGKKPKTGYFGVSHGNKSPNFMAYIVHKKVRFYLGTFRTAIKAAQAFDKKAKELYGDDARLNFP